MRREERNRHAWSGTTPRGTIFGRTKIPIETLRFDFQPHRVSLPLAGEGATRQFRHIRTFDFEFAFIGLRNVHENRSAKFFVYKAICHPEEPTRGCVNRLRCVYMCVYTYVRVYGRWQPIRVSQGRVTRVLRSSCSRVCGGHDRDGIYMYV